MDGRYQELLMVELLEQRVQVGAAILHLAREIEEDARLRLQLGRAHGLAACERHAQEQLGLALVVAAAWHSTSTQKEEQGLRSTRTAASSSRREVQYRRDQRASTLLSLEPEC